MMLRQLMILFACAAGSAAGASSLAPVIIIPGDGSNQLEARLDKPSVVHFFCSKKSDWFQLWLSVTQMLPEEIDCWCDNIRLEVDAATGQAVNAPGVTTRIPGWGTTTSMEELDPAVPAHATAAFLDMVKALTGEGYVRNATLRGAPYDFRYTPDADEGKFGVALKELIEESVAAAGGQRARIITHSMGGLQALYFLQQQTQEWKDAHVALWVPISAPFLGSATEAKLLSSGDDAGLPISAATVRAEQRSYETNIWMLPRNDSGRWGAQPLVTTDAAAFGAGDYDALLDAVGYPTGKAVLPRVTALLRDPLESPPGVPVACLYSLGNPTPRAFYYKGGDFGSGPAVTNGDGDGTVNVESLRACDDWAAAQEQPVEVVVFQSGPIHADMISNATVIAKVLELLAA